MTTAREKIVNVRKDSIMPYRDEMIQKNKDKLKFKDYLEHYITDSNDLENGKYRKDPKDGKDGKNGKGSLKRKEKTERTGRTEKRRKKRDDTNFIYFLFAAYLIIALILFFGGN